MQELQPRGRALTAVDVTPQRVIVARLGDFCRWRSAVSSYESDPWLYMRGKLRELEPALKALKSQQLAAVVERLSAALSAGPPAEPSLIEAREALHGLLPSGDFADAAIHLDAAHLAAPAARQAAVEMLGRLRARSLLEDERDADRPRSKDAERLVEELTRRLGLDVLSRVLERKPRTGPRKRAALRRLRRNVAEYCTVLHLPESPDDLFSSFMLQRVEALALACLRFMDRFR